MNYYYPDSSNISGQKEFLDFYSNCYYLQTKKEVEESGVSGFGVRIIYTDLDGTVLFDKEY